MILRVTQNFSAIQNAKRLHGSTSVAQTYVSMYSPAVVAGSNTHHISPLSLTYNNSTWLSLYIFTMAKQTKNQKQVRGRKQGTARTVSAPTSKTVMGRGPTMGQQQELVINVVKGMNDFTLHPAYIPWLAAVAPSHQEWCLSGLKIWYEPRVGTNVQGTVALGLLEDFQDNLPTSLESIIRLSGSKRGAPWTPFVINAPKQRWLAYSNKSDFESSTMNATDKNSRALGRIVVYADMDTAFSATDVVGRVYIQYNALASLRKPTDPSLQGAQ